MSNAMKTKSNPVKSRVFRIRSRQWGFRFLRSGRVRATASGYDSASHAKRGLIGLVEGLRALPDNWAGDIEYTSDKPKRIKRRRKAQHRGR